MLTLELLADIDELKETCDVECKLAGGRDGEGKVPDDFWPTYSAFANTKGGCIILGVRQRGDKLSIEQGLTKPEKVRKELFDLLENRQKISANLVDEHDVQVHKIYGASIMSVQVRRASRSEKPVHVGRNPFGGTFKRTDSGDRVCDDGTVRRWVAEQQQGSRDSRVLKGFTTADLDQDTIKRFRLSMTARDASHPFLEQDGEDFLRCIKAIATDRETGASGVTVAGLLMFGSFQAIRDEFSHYVVDYREFDDPHAQPGDAYKARITPDGKWSGNVWDFYTRTYRRLVDDLDIPFTIRDGVREEDTAVTKAIRESLVNCLVHADYAQQWSILVIKQPGSFFFRNPGLMRVPIERARKGGQSDCRNPYMQDMFFLAGAGERQGAGVPRIYQGWELQHWIPPDHIENFEQEWTSLELRMVDFIPPAILSALRSRFGERFDTLSTNERSIVACAWGEGEVTHGRAMVICGGHRADMSRLIQGLTKNAFLERVGKGGPASRYRVPDPVPEGAPKGVPMGAFWGPPDARPFVPPRKNAARQEVEAAILQLCEDRFVTARELASALDRGVEKLRANYLRPMSDRDLLERRNPPKSGRHDQAYRTKK